MAVHASKKHIFLQCELKQYGLVVNLTLFLYNNNMELKYIHFIVYAIVFTLYGAVVTAVGPIVIYFAEITKYDQTYFSFIFLARALGYLFGGSLIKQLTKRYKYHTIYVILIIICGVSLIVSSVDFGFWNLSITMFIAASCCCMLNVLCNLCIFQLFVGDKQDYWIQMINLFFGIGGLIGPIIVIFYKELAMRAIGSIIFFTIIPFAYLKSPQGQKTTEQVKSKQLTLNPVSEYSICLLFFFYIASEVGYAAWIPTYAFKAHVANETQASSLASIFWIVNTVARLALLYWQGPVQYRLRLLLRALIACTILVLIFQALGFLTLVSYAGVITSGTCLSAMYALFFSVAIDFGYGLSPSNTANFAMSASLGEGLLVMPIGYAMGFFGYKSLIVLIFLMSAVMLGLFEYAVTSMQKDSQYQKSKMFIAMQDKTPSQAIKGTPSAHNF